MRAPRILIFGWHGSTERNLRAIGRAWQSLDPQLAFEPIVPEAWRGMSRPDGWMALGAELGAKIAAAHASDPRPLVVHAFSNAGFWTALSVLEALKLGHRSAHAALAAVLIDSAPGFPEKVSARFTAKYAAMAMTPSALVALGRTPRARHWLITPSLQLFLGLWHHIAPRQVRFMERSQAAMIEHLRGVPLTALYGDADELVPHCYVEAFLDKAEAAGIAVRRERFSGSAHVRHFVGHRARYLSAMRAALTDRGG